MKLVLLLFFYIPYILSSDPYNSTTNDNDTTASRNRFSYSFTPSRPVAVSSSGVGYCFPFGICTLQTVLTEHSFIALESALMKDLFLTVAGDDCSNVRNTTCGILYGLKVPSTGPIKVNAYVGRTKELQWQVFQKTVDYYCLKSVKYNAYLYINGEDCQQLNSDKECGKVSLFKSDERCNNKFGWKVNMLSNSYVLESLDFPNVYLFFNARACVQGLSVNQNCGRVTGHYFNNMNAILSNVLFRGGFWNIPYQRSLLRSSGLRGN
jgi:hypothetical protein